MYPSSFRTMLYVPATRPEWIAKAFDSGADAVIVDWEDAVAAHQKAEARAHLIAHAEIDARPIWLRINAVESEYYLQDIESCRQIPTLAGIFLPKSESAEDICTVHQALNLPVIAIIESAYGMAQLPHIAAAKGLFALTYGCLDLANDLRLNNGTVAAQAVYERLCVDMLVYSRIHNLHPPIDTVYPDFRDAEGLRARVQWFADLGFAGMMCIHPSQVAIVHEILHIDEAELAMAQKICAKADESGLAAFQIEGKMIDLPLIRKARALLAQSRR